MLLALFFSLGKWLRLIPLLIRRARWFVFVVGAGATCTSWLYRLSALSVAQMFSMSGWDKQLHVHALDKSAFCIIDIYL